MATLPGAKTVTYEEWLEMPEVQDGREEVVNGEIRIIPPPKFRHARIVEKLHRAIARQVNEDEIFVIVAQFGLVIRREPLTTRVPDLALFRKETILEQDGYINSAPQLTIEVLSAANTRREREDKLADYAALGVREVWVVSPEALTVEVLYLEGAQLRRSHILAEGALKPKQFPDVEIDIAVIWPE